MRAKTGAPPLFLLLLLLGLAACEACPACSSNRPLRPLPAQHGAGPPQLQLLSHKHLSVLRLRGGSSSAGGLGLAMKRLVQIVVPSFGGEKGPHPGVVKRVKRFIVALLGLERQVASKSSDKDADEKSHLEAHFKPGQLNYRIQKELKEFMKNPPDGCSVDVGKNIRIWIVTITGAKGSVFEGEKFRLRVSFPTDYPTRPPSVYFLQSPPPPRHEHVYTNGDICLSLLGKDWKPTLTISGLALSIVSMLASASEKRLPQDNAAHANAKPGKAQDDWIYHDNRA